MNLLVSGAGGLVGRAVCDSLREGGHTVRAFVRRPTTHEDEVFWDPAAGAVDEERLGAVDAVVHLAGEPVAAGRWTRARMDRIRDSRTVGTRILAEALGRMATPPRVLVCASAVGWYGDRADEVLTEDSTPGTGFLAEVCHAWETAADPARTAGIRVVHLRIGVVLARDGGALARMVPPFRWGLGGRLGSGKQWMSWIALEDVVRIIEGSLADETLAGPVNVVAPEPVRNADFTRALARTLGRPALLPAPAFVLRLALGGMADEALLASARVVPSRLQDAGFRFSEPELGLALGKVLGS